MRLKKALLTYFSEPKRSTTLEEDLDEYEPGLLREMYYALIRTGLLVNVTQKRTKGALYQTSRAGRAMLEKL